MPIFSRVFRVLFLCVFLCASVANAIIFACFCCVVLLSFRVLSCTSVSFLVFLCFRGLWCVESSTDSV